MKTNKVLPKKRAIFFLNATAECGLATWNELAVYSYLVYRAGQKNTSATIKWIAHGLRVDRKTVAKVLPTLREHGLAAEFETGHWTAKEPPEDKRGWFLMIKRSDTTNWPWHKRFAGYWCYLTAYLGPKISMTPRESAIFWKLYSWKKDGLAPNKKAWETQTLIPYRTILHEIHRLQEKKLLDATGRVTLSMDHHKFWQDRSSKKKPTTTQTLRERFFEWWEDTEILYFPSREDLGDRLDTYEDRMLAAGYSQRDILGYFDALTECLEGYCYACEVFLQRGFYDLFKWVEQIHAKNGSKYPNSKGLLKYKTRSIAPSLLRAVNRGDLYAWNLPSLDQ